MPSLVNVPQLRFRGRHVLAVAVALTAMAAFGWAIDPASAPLQDFVEYWAAGRVIFAGENPYDAVTLFRYEQIASPELTDAIMMWNPPWTFAIAIPFSLLPARIGFVIWTATSFALIWMCADWLWRHYGGAASQRWVALGTACAFVPVFFALRMGQISPLILIGIVGFLWAVQRDREYLAGVFLALTAIKPHLAYLLGLAALLWIIQQQRWRILLGGAAALAAMTAIPLASNPSVFAEYHFALTHQPPQMLSPTIGALLRLIFGAEKLWLQWLPVGVGLCWFAWFWGTRCRRWVWAERAPVLLFASLLTTNYGAWPFDLVVLLVPVIQAAVWVTRADYGDGRPVWFAITVLVGFDALALFTMNVHWAEQYWHVWMTPLLLYGYLTLRRHVRVDPLRMPRLAAA